jgi:hypothetical protein
MKKLTNRTVRMAIIFKKSWTVPLFTLSGSFQWKRQNKLAFLRDKYCHLMTCLQMSFSFCRRLNLLQWQTIHVVLVRVVRKLTGENVWKPESCLAEFFKFKLGYFCYKYNGTTHFKNVNNDLNTNIYSYLETSGGQISSLYSSFFQHQSQLDIWISLRLVFLHWCLICVVPLG